MPTETKADLQATIEGQRQNIAKYQAEAAKAAETEAGLRQQVKDAEAAADRLRRASAADKVRISTLESVIRMLAAGFRPDAD